MPHCPIVNRLVLNMLIMPQDTLVRISRNFSVNPDFSKSAVFFLSRMRHNATIKVEKTKDQFMIYFLLPCYAKMPISPCFVLLNM